MHASPQHQSLLFLGLACGQQLGLLRAVLIERVQQARREERKYQPKALDLLKSEMMQYAKRGTKGAAAGVDHRDDLPRNGRERLVDDVVDSVLVRMRVAVLLVAVLVAVLAVFPVAAAIVRIVLAMAVLVAVRMLLVRVAVRVLVVPVGFLGVLHRAPKGARVHQDFRVVADAL